MGDSIRELRDLYAEATQAPEGAPTAQKLGPCNGRNFKLGRLLITSISLKDDGLRGGGKDVVLGTMTEYIPDPDASREMEGLGLPTDFGEDKQTKAAQRKQKKKAAAARLAPSIDGGPPAVATSQPVLRQDQQPDIFQDPAVLRARTSVRSEATASAPQSQREPVAASPASSSSHQVHQPRPIDVNSGSPTPPLSPRTLVLAVQALGGLGFNLPAVWHSMGMLGITPETVTPADVYAAAQVAGAAPPLIYHVFSQAAAAAAAEQQKQQQNAPTSLTAAAKLSSGLDVQMQGLSLLPGQQQHQQLLLPNQAAAQPHAPARNHRMDSPWQQDYDPATRHLYYFNVAEGITQWEPPPEGYRPRIVTIDMLEQSLLLGGQQQQQQQRPDGVMTTGSNRSAVDAAANTERPQAAATSPSKLVEAQRRPSGPQQKQHPQPRCAEPWAHTAAASQPNPQRQWKQHHNHQVGRTWQQQELMQHHAAAEEEAEGERLQQRVVLDADTAAFVRSMLPRNMAKYWLQRFSLFSKYDQGIQMDTEGWYSVTPEVLALHQALQCKRYGGGYLVADAMAGCGGNVIQMALVFPEVLGIEISARRCGMAAQNAAVYGVQARTNFLCCDFFAAAPRLMADAIFVSPPWGGPMYGLCDTFDVLDSMIDGQRSIRELLDVCMEAVERTWASARGVRQSLAAEADRPASGRGVVSLFLPRNTDLLQLASIVPEGALWNVERNFVNGKLKGITLYCFGSEGGKVPDRGTIPLVPDAPALSV